MNLRKSNFEDWRTLLDWRNDPVSRKNSFTENEISELEHINWYKQSLKNDKREFYILEENSTPIGVIRSDKCESDEFVLSWNISSKFRGKGYGNIILELFLKNKKGTFIAEIKPDNLPSILIVEKNGFKKENDLKYIKKQ
jgi:spore coat polysaccharide biosynthesis protein SpsF